MLVVKTYAAFKQLDILIVNHGVWPPHDQPFATMEMNQWYDTLEVNLNSVFGLAQAAVGLMLPYSSWAAALSRTPDAAPLWDEAYKAAAIEAGAKPYGETPYGPVTPDKVRGHIVLVASTAAQRGEAFHADYAASKGALLSLTKSLSSELGPQGILCNCVAPGWVRTDMSAGTLSDPIASKKTLDLIPLGRAAEPEEIAGPIVFLCTPLAGFISGEIWNVNGGAVLVG
jgi:3-oxoacyl-[acyl-carrier protein] reductase